MSSEQFIIKDNESLSTLAFCTRRSRTDAINRRPQRISSTNASSWLRSLTQQHMQKLIKICPKILSLLHHLDYSTSFMVLTQGLATNWCIIHSNIRYRTRPNVDTANTIRYEMLVSRFAYNYNIGVARIFSRCSLFLLKS